MGDETDNDDVVIPDDVLQSDAVKDLIAEAVKVATEGLETNKNSILEEKRTLSEKLKLAEANAKRFEGLDIEKIKTMIDSMDASAEAKLIAEGKIDEVIAARTSAVKSSYEDKYTEKDAEIASLNEANNTIMNKYEGKLIGDSIRTEAIKQGMLPEAVDKAIRDAEGMFKVNETGGVEARKIDEFVNSPERFVKALKETAPFYWPSNAEFRMSGSDGGSATDLDARMEAAAASGDFEAYKKLRAGKAK